MEQKIVELIVNEAHYEENNGTYTLDESQVEFIAERIVKLFAIHGVSKVKEFICPVCTKLIPIVKVIYECECGVKHEALINDETEVCGLHEEAAECKHRNNGKCMFSGSCYFQICRELNTS